jgi:DNA-binding LacI/PurR family transcriptional regulator
MTGLPQRFLLTDQAAALLRKGLQIGRWGELMPSEADLCLELQVSRVTLRRALQHLAREGLIQFGGRGSHHRVLLRPTTKGAAQGTIVRLLSPLPRHQVNTSTQLVQNALQERLSQEGYTMHVEFHPGLFQRFSEKDLQRLASLPDTAGWLLYLSTREIQEWFARHQIPTVVTGSVYPGINLANVAFDFRSSCRHAAGLFLARKRSEMVFLTPAPMTAGDCSSAEGFLEGAEKGRPPGRLTVVNYDTTVPDLCRVLREQLARNPRPNAFLVSWPEHTFSVLGYFIRQGLRVPEDAAIISRGDDQYLNYAIPSVARYRIDSERMGRKAAELLLDQIRHGHGKIRSIGILPEFVPGETLG